MSSEPMNTWKAPRVRPLSSAYDAENGTLKILPEGSSPGCDPGSSPSGPA